MLLGFGYWSPWDMGMLVRNEEFDMDMLRQNEEFD